MRIEGIEVLGDAACGRHLCMIGAGGHQALGRLACVEVMTFVAELLEQAAAHDHQSLVWPVGLVEGEEINVSAQLSDVPQAVRRPGDATANPDNAGETRALRDARDRVDV